MIKNNKIHPISIHNTKIINDYSVIHPASIHYTKIKINDYSIVHPASVKSIFEIKYHKYKNKYLLLKNFKINI